MLHHATGIASPMIKKSFTMQDKCAISGDVWWDCWGFLMARAIVRNAIDDQKAILDALEQRGPLRYYDFKAIVPDRLRLRGAVNALRHARCIKAMPGSGYTPYQLIHKAAPIYETDSRRHRPRLQHPNVTQLSVVLSEIL
jgi:hypothetical protein